MVFVNQDSPLLEDENVELGTTMLVSSTQRIKRKLEEEGEDKMDEWFFRNLYCLPSDLSYQVC